MTARIKTQDIDTPGLAGAGVLKTDGVEGNRDLDLVTKIRQLALPTPR